MLKSSKVVNHQKLLCCFHNFRLHHPLQVLLLGTHGGLAGLMFGHGGFAHGGNEGQVLDPVLVFVGHDIFVHGGHGGHWACATRSSRA